MLVPPMNAYAGVWPGPQKLHGRRVDFAETMSVPGATTSGLIRRSVQGPRLLKPARHCGSPRRSGSAIGGFGKSPGQTSP